MTDAQKGILAIIATCVIWGFSGIYYKMLSHVPPLEVLAHRTVWSVFFLGLVILFKGRVGEVISVLRKPKEVAILVLSALMISMNWFGFIYSIQVGWAVEASLGYYIFPLVAVALGFLFLGERFSFPKAFAIILALIAVLTLSFGLGVTPWISLLLAGTFGLYGFLKRGVNAGPVLSVFIEVLLILPITLIWLYGVHSLGWQGVVETQGGFFGSNVKDTALLAFSGVITGGPLILFSYASKRLTYSTIGLIQYLNPTIQFFVAAVIFGEIITKWHAIAFPLIWIGLAFFSWESWRQDRSARKRSTRAGTSSTT